MGTTGTSRNTPRATRLGLQRGALLVGLAALGALGFEGSAIGGHATQARHSASISIPGGITAPTIIGPTTVAPPTTTTTTASTSTKINLPTAITPTLIAPILPTTPSTPTTPTSTPTTTPVTTSGGGDGGNPTIAEPTTTTAALPVIVPAPPSAPFLPPQLANLNVAVSGGGTVTGGRIACGAQGSKCFGAFKPGTEITLHAGAATGFRFSGWTGGCSGSGPSCKLQVSKAAKVSARFTPIATTNGVDVALDKADFAVRWEQSVGSGKLVIGGSIGKAANVDIRLSRPGGGALLSEHVTLASGRFSLTVPLDPGVLAGGAQLTPGAFVVTISGRSGSVPLPQQVKSITLGSPAEGVVGSASATVAAAKRSILVRYDFAAQPAGKPAITVAWFQPNGRLLGTAAKSNRPQITSSISSGSPLPRGMWRADLRVGSAVVKSVTIQVK